MIYNHVDIFIRQVHLDLVAFVPVRAVKVTSQRLHAHARCYETSWPMGYIDKTSLAQNIRIN